MKANRAKKREAERKRMAHFNGKPVDDVNMPKIGCPLPNRTAIEPDNKRIVRSGEVRAIKRLIERIRRASNKSPQLEKMRRRKLMTKRLYYLLKCTDAEYDDQMLVLNSNCIATKIFYYIKEFDLYLRLLWTRLQAQSSGACRMDIEWINERLESKYSIRKVKEVVPGNNSDAMVAWSFLAAAEVKLSKANISPVFEDMLGMLKDVDLCDPKIENLYMVSSGLN